MDKKLKNFLILIVSIIVMFGIIMLPIADLEVSGRIYLGIIVSMLILWFTEAVPAPATFFLMVGFTPVLQNYFAGIPYGDGFKEIMSQLSTNSTALLISAFFIVSGVNKSGIGRRIALLILRLVGSTQRMLVIGIFIAAAVINMFIPAAMSVSALLTAVVGGIIADYKLDLKSNMAKSIYLSVGVGTIAGNIFCQTAGAPAITVTNLINTNFGHEISYFEYMMYGLPVALVMDIVAIFVICRLFPASEEGKMLPGGNQAIVERLKELGPMSVEEKKIGLILVATIVLWMTNGKLHTISAQTVALFAVFLMMCPKIGCYTFKDMNATVPWGTIMFCTAAMSVATGMVTYGTAQWIVNKLVAITNLTSLPLVAIVIVGMLIMIFMSMLFSVRAAAVTTLIPLVVALGLQISEVSPGFANMRFAMMMYYPVLFAVVLPVHTPYTLIPNAAGGFEAKDLIKVQIPTVLLTGLFCVLCYFTYWNWIGLN